jgi:hypothetical protein
MLLLGSVLASAALAIFGDRTPSGGSAVEVAPRPDPAAATAPPPNSGKRKRAVDILALQPRATLIGHDAPTEPPGLFGTNTMFAAAAPPASIDETPAAPVVPPLPFIYLGKKYENAKWEVYLAIGDQTYFVREGSVIDQAYVVNAIKPPTMTLTFLPLKQMQNLTIGGDE